MKLYVPHTGIAEATECFLATYGCVPLEIVRVDLTGQPWGYQEHLKECWERGEGFVMLEHDVVPWPGAVQDLLECPWPWCFFGYLAGIDFVENGAAPFGLVRFTAEFIAATPDVWTQMRSRYEGCPDPWRMCDIHLGDYMRGRGLFRPHQHTPAVLNANPRVLSRLDP